MTYDHRSRGGRRLTATETDLEVFRQKAFLIGVRFPDMSFDDADRSLEELALLADTAGCETVDQEMVRRDSPDPASFIGAGKARELADLSRSLDVDVVVFDNELTPAQQRNLHKMFGCDVVDREALILDIFAQHATTREGALQVELALLRYNLPRLRGRGTSLSQQGAGIGTRGPGETKLETDRRRILSRISKLERELTSLTKTRATQRKARRKASIPQISVVGYTNAGKSTLLNRVTTAEVLTEDRLFSTLDATVRRCTLPDGKFVLLSDTVGFVRRLPHHLVEAFQSTLEDARESEMLIHLVDASDPDPVGQIAAVRDVLFEIDAHTIPELLVFNKIDKAEPITVGRLRSLYPDAFMISALRGDGIDELLDELGRRLKAKTIRMVLEIPYDRGDLVAAAYRLGDVVEEAHQESATVLEVRMPLQSVSRFAEFVVD